MTIGAWLRKRFPGRNAALIRLDDRSPADNDVWLEVGLEWLKQELPVTFVELKLRGEHYAQRDETDFHNTVLTWESESRLLNTEILDV